MFPDFKKSCFRWGSDGCRRFVLIVRWRWTRIEMFRTSCKWMVRWWSCRSWWMFSWIWGFVGMMIRIVMIRITCIPFPNESTKDCRRTICVWKSKCWNRSVIDISTILQSRRQRVRWSLILREGNALLSESSQSDHHSHQNPQIQKTFTTTYRTTIWTITYRRPDISILVHLHRHYNTPPTHHWPHLKQLFLNLWNIRSIEEFRQMETKHSYAKHWEMFWILFTTIFKMCHKLG